VFRISDRDVVEHINSLIGGCYREQISVFNSLLHQQEHLDVTSSTLASEVSCTRIFSWCHSDGSHLHTDEEMPVNVAQIWRISECYGRHRLQLLTWWLQ